MKIQLFCNESTNKKGRVTDTLPIINDKSYIDSSLLRIECLSKLIFGCIGQTNCGSQAGGTLKKETIRGVHTV